MISVSNAYFCMRLGRFFVASLHSGYRRKTNKNLQPMRQKEEKL